MSYFVGLVRGVAVLDNIMYVVCTDSSTILLYNKDTYSPLDVVINVTGMKCPTDIVVCRDDRQLYVADWGGLFSHDCIWRVSADDHSDEKWLPTESTTDIFHANTLSVTSRRLLVTSSWWSPSLREYSTTDRQLLRVVQLPGYVKSLYHGIETTRGTFVISHRGTGMWWSMFMDTQYSAVSELIGFSIILLIAITIYCFDIPN